MAHSSMSRVEADHAPRLAQAPTHVVPRGKWQTLAEGGYFWSERVKEAGGQSLQPAGVSRFHVKKTTLSNLCSQGQMAHPLWGWGFLL